MLKGKTAMAAAFALVLLLAATNVRAQSPRLYVGNAGGDDMSVIDLNSLKVIGDIKLGEKVHGACIQADGRRLFSTVESDHTLRVIDTATNRELASVKLTGRPNQCAATPDGKYVVVPIRDPGGADIVDVGRGKVVKVLPALAAHNAFSYGSNRYVFVSSMKENAIKKIDLEKMDYAAVIPVGGEPRPYVVTPDGGTIYAALTHLHGFVIVDVAQKKVVKRVELPIHNHTPKPMSETPGTLTHGLGLSPDGRDLWVTSLPDGVVYIYDLKAGKVTASVQTGDGPNWISFLPNGKEVAVSNSDGDSVSIFDPNTRRELARIPVGKTPRRLVATEVPAGTPVAAK